MGVSWFACAGYGVKVDATRLYREERRSGCHHVMVNATAKFCPECGKPAWLVVKVPIEGYDPDAWDEPEFRGLWVVNSSCGRVAHILWNVVEASGGSHEKCRAMAKVADADVATAYHEVRTVLEPLGLWDELEFGLWCLLSCS